MKKTGFSALERLQLKLIGCKIVRLNRGLPLTGFVLEETLAVNQKDKLYKVIVYGYDATPKYWHVEDCSEIKLKDTSLDVKGWAYLLHKNNGGKISL